MRSLDLSSLRSFIAVADAGGVTRAANLLNLTQSAVSMQMKRLEEGLNVELLDRSARTVALTAAGEQLLGYARRMLALNDDVVTRLTGDEYEGELSLGVPHDIIYPHIPTVLRRFHAEFPRMKVQLQSSYTRRLKELYLRGECDLILTTEDHLDAGGETLAKIPLVWLGAPNGNAWKTRPLRLAFEPNCIFRGAVQSALDTAGIPWEMAIEAESSRAIEACLSADLAVSAMLEGSVPGYLDVVVHGGALPDLARKKINLYVSELTRSLPRERLSELLRLSYAG
ncbi:LysR family transcriptional regulator [Qingshengfaniella alkalisoli]|uniref:LysR family transcriptional regulator n=1 Tax=Qingshengfaniella alkalisoli TaxID=2599296 RepID=A0A5B8IU45_9RHOB|nr:LysR family transcriptional regulator [Qingshengfaniella alkalisoli]QDY69144.1 LysR family transcriptional regulator [Qingshengfaniella alkalisoli]